MQEEIKRQMIKQEKVCVVTVLYKAEKHIDTFIKSLEDNLSSINELVIVDNNSKDNASKKIKDWCEKNNIKIQEIINKINTGYTAAINQGIKLAEKDNEHILVTNNDLIIKKDTIKRILEIGMSANYDLIGIPGRSDDGEVFLGFNYKEKYLKLVRFIQIPKSYLEFLIKNDIECFPTDFPPGLFILFHRNFFKKVGYYDEELFFSGDETDFAIRINKSKNIKSLIALNGYDMIDHHSVATSGNSLIKNKNYVRGYVYILLKHTDKIFSVRFWMRLGYFLLTIIYSRPSYSPYLFYHAIKSVIHFRKIKNS